MTNGMQIALAVGAVAVVGVIAWKLTSPSEEQGGKSDAGGASWIPAPIREWWQDSGIRAELDKQTGATGQSIEGWVSGAVKGAGDTINTALNRLFGGTNIAKD